MINRQCQVCGGYELDNGADEICNCDEDDEMSEPTKQSEPRMVELAEATARVSRLESEARLHDTIVKQLQRGQIAYCDQLRAELDDYREALRFYADKESYERDGFKHGFCAAFVEIKDDRSKATSDGNDLSVYGGKRARAVLAKWAKVKND